MSAESGNRTRLSSSSCPSAHCRHIVVGQTFNLVARAGTVVLWELTRTGEARQRRALRLIGFAFVALSTYIAVQSSIVLATGDHPKHSLVGIAWTSLTAIAMFALAAMESERRERSSPVTTRGLRSLINR